MIINLFAILIFSSLFLLSFLLFTNPWKVNIKANAWFAVFLLLWSSFWFDEIYYFTTLTSFEVSSLTLYKFFQFLTPVPFYISIRYFTNSNYKLDKFWLLFLILPVIYLLLLVFQPESSPGSKIAGIIIILIHALFYAIASFILIRKHQKNIQNFASNTSEIDLSWLESIIAAVLILTVMFAMFNLIFYEANPNLFMNGITLLVVLFTAYHSLKQKDIVVPDDQVQDDEIIPFESDQPETLRRKILSEDRLVEIKSQLNDMMIEQELYLDCNLNLIDLSEKLNITSHQLSYVINYGFNQNFYGFVNNYRVKKAKTLLSGKVADKYTMIGIAYESGFNSKTSFNTTFKKITGQTPSEYKKKCSDL